MVGDRFILLIVLNIFVFYASLDKKCPHFLFISRMYIKQIIVGCFGIIDCLIPIKIFYSFNFESVSLDSENNYLYLLLNETQLILNLSH